MYSSKGRRIESGTAAPVPHAAPGRSNRESLAGVAATASVVSWGIGSVVAKIVDLDGLTLTLHRMWVGLILAVVMLAVAGGPSSWRGLARAVPGGVWWGVHLALQFSALQTTTVANATMIAALQPALALVVAGPLFGQRATRREVLYTFVATAGVMVVVLGSSTRPEWSPRGDALAVGGLVTFLAYFAASKRARQTLTTFEYQAGATCAGLVAIAAIALVSRHDVSVSGADTWGWVLFIAVVPGGGHLMMNWAHAYLPLYVSSLMTLAVPVVAVVGAAIFLDETIGVVQVAGMMVVMMAMTMVLSGRARAAQTGAPPKVPAQEPELT